MQEPVLVVMAAGIGSRYGGLKQMDPVGKHGEFILDYSLFDAQKAGFRKIVFIVNRRIEQDFKQIISNRIDKRLECAYVLQEIEALFPENLALPPERKKPWGTGHAVLCCKDVIRGPFAVINADDYYGAQAFGLIYDRLKAKRDGSRYAWCMVGYKLNNTLTDYGHVARGVCELSGTKLVGMKERVHIEKYGGHAAYTEDGGKNFVRLSDNTIVSMNMWGFTAAGIFDELSAGWPVFLESALSRNPAKAEYFLPDVVGKAVREGRAEVDVLPSPERWYGITYREDKPAVVAAIGKMTLEGAYPEPLWRAE